jgi:hypothetical protein
MSNSVEYVLSLRDLASSKLKDITKASDQAESSLSNLQGGFNNLGGKIGGAIGGYLALSSVKDVLTQMIEVRAEFQKFQAVLSTSLGSDAEAGLQLSLIQDIASKTPFSVQELSGAFVKLVNQGFKPTSEEMIKLGDLASSTGKGFDQLTEAIIDAQVGEFERLKEFGVRAEKHGDKVKFTFKGITKEVNYTSDAIKDYITGLGGMEGVAGSMEKISQTLGGQLSNLGDSWDNLLNTMGSRTDGFIGQTIQGISNMLNTVSDMMLTAGERGKNGFAQEVIDFKNDKEKSFIEVVKNMQKKGGKWEVAADSIISKDIEKTISELRAQLSEGQDTFLNYRESAKNDMLSKFINGLSGREFSEEDQAFLDKMEVSNAKIEEKIKALKGLSAVSILDSFKNKQAKTKDETKAKNENLTKASRPTQINIDIGNQIGNLTFNTTTIKESVGVVIEELSKALVTVVNDSQRLANQ